MRKERAIELLGGSVSSAAEAIGITPPSVCGWPDELPARIEDRVLDALARKYLPQELLKEFRSIATSPRVEMDWSAYMADILKSSGMTQIQLAFELNCSQASITEILRWNCLQQLAHHLLQRELAPQQVVGKQARVEV